jgi:hypothetical protein
MDDIDGDDEGDGRGARMTRRTRRIVTTTLGTRGRMRRRCMKVVGTTKGVRMTTMTRRGWGNYNNDVKPRRISKITKWGERKG